MAQRYEWDLTFLSVSKNFQKKPTLRTNPNTY